MPKKYKPTDAMASAAKRGLAMREEQPPSNKGGTSVGLARARQLIKKQDLDLSIVKRMYSFFSRHEVDKQSDSWKKGDSKGEQAWLMWGGDAGYSWSKKIVKQAKKSKENNIQTNKIVVKGGKHCVMSEDGKRSFGCYSTEEEAKKRLGQVEYFKSMNQLRLNVVNRVNPKKIVRSGNTITITDVVPIVDNVVMNGGLYPAEEIEAAFHTLNDTIAPMGHPQDKDGNFISAKTYNAMRDYYAGAGNKNVRKVGNRVLMDVEINIEQAKALPKGKELLKRIENAEKGKGEPIHVSTGLLLNREEAVGNNDEGQKYTWIARNMDFDHNAILLDEVGAATPKQGVGMFVNSQGEECEVQVFVNNECADHRVSNKGISLTQIQEEIRSLLREEISDNEWAYPVEVWDDHFVYRLEGKGHESKLYKRYYKVTDDLVELMPEKKEAEEIKLYPEKGKAGMIKKLLDTVVNAVPKGYNISDIAKIVPNQEDDDIMRKEIIAQLIAVNCGKTEAELEAMSDSELAAVNADMMKKDKGAEEMKKGSVNELMDKVNAMTDKMDQMNGMYEKMNGMYEDMKKMKKDMSANEDAERKTLAKELDLDEDEAKGMSTNAMKKMAAKLNPSFGIQSGFEGNSQSESFQLEDEGAPE